MLSNYLYSTFYWLKLEFYVIERIHLDANI